MHILETIGNTPLVELRHLNPRKNRVRIMAKLEGHNPGGSIKDRAALYMIRAAEKAGRPAGSQTLLEATSGNTGIALAMIGAARGYRVKLVIPACASLERIRILEAFGAEVELTPAESGTDGAIRRARELMERRPAEYCLLNQFANGENVRAHRETTGPELLSQSGGEIDAVVAGLGTTGTIMGLAEFFKDNKSGTRIIGVEPEKGHAIQGLKNMEEAEVPAIFNESLLDLRLTVNDEDAYGTARSLVLREGIFAGMSSGAALSAALELARDMRSGTIAVILPDRGDRYLSTTLFRSICGKCPP
ncbi:MAG: cysteine synthase family protein [Acidobacteriota bacterium]|nr:cysteine synthase family protein [Acidobacteriota bacterium]